jgi:tryptophanyl-tRNA synthetase
VFSLHGHFTPSAEKDEIEVLCQTAGIGCVDCKNRLADNMAASLAPVRERARELQAEPDQVWEMLAAGGSRARSVARETIAEVRERMGLGSPSA